MFHEGIWSLSQQLPCYPYSLLHQQTRQPGHFGTLVVIDLSCLALLAVRFRSCCTITTRTDRGFDPPPSKIFETSSYHGYCFNLQFLRLYKFYQSWASMAVRQINYLLRSAVLHSVAVRVIGFPNASQQWIWNYHVGECYGMQGTHVSTEQSLDNSDISTISPSVISDCHL